MASRNNIFVDANVVLEIVLNRNKQLAAKDLLSKQKQKSYISALTVHLVMHFGKKYSSLTALEALLSSFTICALTKDDVDWAFTNTRNDDFEDALQITVAIRNGCKEFYTFDQDLYETYKSLPTMDIKLV